MGSTKGCGKRRGLSGKPSCRARPREAAISPAETIYDPLSAGPAPGPHAVSRQPHPTRPHRPDRTRFLTKYEPLPNSGAPAATTGCHAEPDRHRRASGRVDHQFANSRPADRPLHLQRREQPSWLDRSPCCLPASRCGRSRRPSVHHQRRLVDQRNALSLSAPAHVRRAETAFKVNVAQQLGSGRPAHRPLQFRAALLQCHRLFDGDRLALAAAGAARQSLAGVRGLSLLRGRHTLKFGGNFLHFQLNYLQSNLTRGEYTYTGGLHQRGRVGNRQRRSIRRLPAGLSPGHHPHQRLGQAYLRQNDYAGFAQDAGASRRLSRSTWVCATNTLRPIPKPAITC